MNKAVILFLTLVLCGTSLDASDTSRVSSSLAQEVIAADSIVFTQVFNPADYNFQPGDIPVYSDSVYEARLGQLSSPVDLVYNSTVRRCIDLYVLNKRGQLEKMVGLSQVYFPIVEEIFAQYGVPSGLKYLAIIESALNPLAVSRAGATGMWQFMYSTGKLYDLHVTSYIDDRKDPYEATHAAARYLRDLNNIYDDWSMAIAAYNCGPGTVNRAMRKSGADDYWGIKDYLPSETRTYVPLFIAATYAMNYHREHNITSVVPEFFLEETDTVMVFCDVNLEQVTKYTGITMNELQFFNPSLKLNMVPRTYEGYCLRIPKDKMDVFNQQRDSILAATLALLTTSSGELSGYETISTSGTTTKKRVVYTVRSGDNLSTLARKYRCTVTDIKTWNKLRSTTIRIGQKLVFYTISKSTVTPKTTETEITIPIVRPDSLNAGTTTEVSNGGAGEGKPVEIVKEETEEKYINYTIRSGDTLWEICQRYPRNTINGLKKINSISNVNSLKPGRKLRILG